MLLESNYKAPIKKGKTILNNNKEKIEEKNPY
jgi:hypothetical protein